MAKRPRQEWSQLLASLVREGANLAARWLPKGAAELEKQARQTAKEVQDFRQRRQQAAALTPRKARLLWLLPLPLIPAMVIALASGQFTAFVVNAGTYSLFLAGAMLARHGFQQEVDQRQQRFQTAVRWPVKTLGGLTVALATALTAWAGAGHSLPISLARDILAEIAHDPKDLRRARKFLNTYLDGAQRVVTGYAEAHSNHCNQTLNANFRRVLVSIEEVFGQQLQRLLENDLLDLDVNMEVLEAQLKREGLN